MTAWDRLEERNIQQGIQQGLQKGVQQGERAVLLRQLRKRFGNEVGADAERRLASASSEQIGTWAERVLSAPTLAETLGD
jgi:hypothetical protein